MAEVKVYVTPIFKLSFPAVFEAESYDGGAAKFSAVAIWTPKNFTPADKKRWSEMIGGLDAESKSRFKKALEALPANYKKGIRDGNEKADMEGYGDGTKFATLSTKMRPGVIGPNGPIKPEEGNEDEIYPGCLCRATVTVYSYDNKGKGVAFGLRNLKKVGDAQRLDSRTDADEDFSDVDDEWLDEGEGETEDYLE